MLTEIYCDAFGVDKKIPFTNGLNIIQGRGGNSIGKTNALKIIDYAFGGKHYSDSNDDVLKNVGNHDICFCHTFGGKPYYFRRNADKANKVQCCSNNNYIAQKEIPLEKFCEWLLEQYNIQGRSITFRQFVGLYTRVWNKPNKEVNRPLYNHNSQTVSNAIITLIKAFNKYTSIGELDAQNEFFKKRERALTDAANYHFIKLPTKKEYNDLLSKLEDIDKNIAQLKRNLSHGSVESATIINEKSDMLINLRTELLRQHGRISREIRQNKKNLEQLCPVEESSFTELLEFFPDINMERIKEVQGFHQSLQKVLVSELEEEQKRLQKDLETINIAIAENDHEIQVVSGLPTLANNAMTEMANLLMHRVQMQNQLELYNDKIADAEQKKENKKNLDQEMEKITSEIEKQINEKIENLSNEIATSNSKPPVIKLSSDTYTYGVQDNTGTGKAYTDLILFDLAILYLTDLPFIIHDSFLFNNIDDSTKQSFIKLYNQFSSKQVFISLDTYFGDDDEETGKILFSSNRLYLSEQKPLFGKDWRK